MDASAANALPRPDPTSERAARMTTGLEWLMILVVIALGFLIASFAVRNSDFWLHLATGRMIADGTYEFGKDPYSFATEGRTWVNHAWLYDLVLYKVYQLRTDGALVVYLKAFLSAVLAVVLLLMCRPDPRDRIIPGTKFSPGRWLATIVAAAALIAMAPRLIVQPMMLSFLFFAITLMALLRSRVWDRKWLPLVLLPMFLVWVNIDGWFLLGPALIGIFLVGEALQTLLPGDLKPTRSRLPLLAATLVGGLAICLVNPHHYRAFTSLPIELQPNIVDALRNDPGWRPQFATTWDVVYRDRADMGKSVAGVCYLLLILLGAGSFLLNVTRIRVPLLIVWLSTLVLTLFVSWRLIPFFAIASVPAVALNVHAFFARLPYRKGVIVDSPAAATEAPGQPAAAASEGWWPGAVETAPTTVRQVSKAVGGEVTLTPESMIAFTGVMGRLLTLCGGIGLLLATYPGWLHAQQSSDAQLRRLSWRIVADPTFVGLAEQINEWRRTNQLPATARGFALHLEVPNYCAWYAPGSRFLLDYRFPLLGDLSADYVKVKTGLSEWASGTELPEDFAEVLRRRNIDYVVVTGAEAAGGERLMGRMLFDVRQWALWYQNGRTAVFGWHDLAVARQPDPLQLDLISMAFGRRVQRLPLADTFGVTRYPPPEAPPARGFLERFLSPPPPPAPPESVTAGLYLDLREQAVFRAADEAQAAILIATHLGKILVASNLPGVFTIDQPISQQFAEAVITQQGAAHPLPAAVAVTAVREARRGTLKYPNDGFPYLMLGMAYNTMPYAGSIMRPLHQIVAYRQAMARMSPEQADGPPGPIVTLAWLSLHELHRTRNEMDLAEESLEKALAQYDRHPPVRVPEPRLKPLKEQLQKELTRLRNDMLAARDNFQIAAEELRKRNSPPQQEAALAMRFGLVREALRVLEENSGQLDPSGWMQLTQMYLAVGRVEEALRVIEQVPAQYQEQFEMTRAFALAVAGEYARAGQLFEKQLALLERADDPKQSFVAAAVVFQQLHFACVESAAQPVRLALTAQALETYATVTRSLAATKRQKGDLLATRAMLAVEEGDILPPRPGEPGTAQKYFKAALDLKSGFDGYQTAAAYLRILEQQTAK